ncbi:MAG: nucleotidyltransferase substrate binding protein [Puniceicoccales bacterium]|jgi:nucleotidyltransferase substrate binding protein (TIGR01987 family)|nr:nucleotidyltransferase substrate binding protein [Puniceicoccales bacterium]
MAGFDIDISPLKKAIKTLEESWGVLRSSNDSKLHYIVLDSCIKRFEYTVETAWKLMKRFLKLRYGRSDQELTVNNIFRLMEGYGFIQSWENWREYYVKRNDTAHEYNEDKARTLIQCIPAFISDVSLLASRLESAIKNDA